jgi:hypothetical protein
MTLNLGHKFLKLNVRKIVRFKPGQCKDNETKKSLKDFHQQDKLYRRGPRKVQGLSRNHAIEAIISQAKLTHS